MKIRNIISNILLALNYYRKYAPLYFYGQLIFTVFVSFIATIQGPITIKFLMDAIINDKPIEEIITFLIIVTLLVIVRHVFACYIVEYLDVIANIKVQEKILKEFYEKAVKMDLEYYETPSFYTDYIWAAQQATTQFKGIYNSFNVFISRLSETVFVGGVLVVINPMLMFFAIAMSLIALIGHRKQIKISKVISHLNEIRKMEEVLISYLIDVLSEDNNGGVLNEGEVVGNNRNIMYEGNWKICSGNAMTSEQYGDIMGVLYYGSKVKIVIKPESYPKNLGFINDGIEEKKVLKGDEDIIEVEEKECGFHYVVLTNISSTSIVIESIECLAERNKITTKSICEFYMCDGECQGKWSEKYGTIAYDIFGMAYKDSPVVRINYNGFTNRVWNVLPEFDNGQPLLLDGKKWAACKCFNDKAYIDIVVAGNEPKIVSFYVMECFNIHRSITINAYDADTEILLSNYDVDIQSNGKYVSFKILGHVQFAFVNQEDSLGVVSAVFLD